MLKMIPDNFFTSTSSAGLGKNNLYQVKRKNHKIIFRVFNRRLNVTSNDEKLFVKSTDLWFS